MTNQKGPQMHTPVYEIKGIYQDRIRRADGTVRAYGWRSNIVVNQCRMLLAAFMRGQANTFGIEQLLIGQGDPAWDVNPPAPPARTISALVDANPVAVAVAAPNITYLSAAGTVVPGPTSILEISLDLGPGVPPPVGTDPYPLREFALMGRIGAADFMIDYVQHPVIHKAAGDTLTRTIRLQF